MKENHKVTEFFCENCKKEIKGRYCIVADAVDFQEKSYIMFGILGLSSRQRWCQECWEKSGPTGKVFVLSCKI